MIKNLNSIESDLIFIRNIDNVQHFKHAGQSARSRKVLAGVLLQFQSAIFDLLNAMDAKRDYSTALLKLNDTYQLKLTTDDLNNPTKIRSVLNRPIRICGMVKNQGQPGGGPFWVRDEQGNETRQIVEKSQISNTPDQLSLLIKTKKN